MSSRAFKSILALVMAPVIVMNVEARKVSVSEPLAASRITAIASSSIPSSPAANAVNGKGMIGETHVANNLGEGMWVSKPSKDMVRYSGATHDGAVWFVCIIDSASTSPAVIDRISIWNHNQNEHTRRGLRKVYIEYSADGSRWETLRDNDCDYHIIPESRGKNPERADYTFTFPPVKAKYVCFTAASGHGIGNHYDLDNDVVRRETDDLRQNPDYYGLAEIRFYRTVSRDIDRLSPVTLLTPHFSQGYRRTDNGPSREFYIDFDAPLYAGGNLSFDLNGKVWDVNIPANPNGINRYDGLFPPGYMNEATSLKVTLKSPQGQVEKILTIPAARQWDVAFFPHSHQDIGYTHRQDDVMKLQWRNLERAMDLAERTRNYPDEARYRWNTEATWSIAGYLDEYAGTERAQRVIDAVRDGIVCINAPLGSELTGISRQEELMHYFDDAHRLEQLTGVPINTAMMSDVPGQVWGLATAMANNGVKYYSPGPNYVPLYGKIGNDRAAALHIDWGDRPFYWQSQSGRDRVLVWQAGRGYSWFHGWLAGRLSVCGVEPIWEYLEELETDRFPYNTCYLRYTVHGDNGPPDELMPDIIREWNERYESPRFHIASSAEFFENFEHKYGEILPVYGGDMTPTWEDGAASTARETAANRESSARLARTGILHAMYGDKASFPRDSVDVAWKNVILFSEHTWGASASGSDPFSKFTRDLWETKKSYGDSAMVQSIKLHNNILPISSTGRYIHVANTSLWTRTDVVTVDVDFNPDTEQLVDDLGQRVEVQRMSDGRLLFIATDIAPLSSRVYTIKPSRRNLSDKSSMAAGLTLDNGLLTVTIDPVKGTISSLKMNGSDFEYVSGEGLNDYVYSDRFAQHWSGIDSVKSVTLVDDGPLAATLRVIADAPGCDRLTRDITLYRGIDRVDIVNHIDKQDIIEYENVRFAFPFSIAHPEIALDLAMSEIHPEREQLSGVNKHYYSLQNGLSLRDLEHGIVLTSIDAPFIETGTQSGQDYRLNPRHGYGWWRSAQISPTIYSWVMTNTWRTNYKASQGGPATFRYTLRPCNPYDTELKKSGFEREHPLTVFTSDISESVPSLFTLNGNHRIALSGMTPSLDGSGYILRLQNMDNEVVNTSFNPGTVTANTMARCNWREEAIEIVDPESFWLRPYEYVMIKITQ